MKMTGISGSKEPAQASSTSLRKPATSKRRRGRTGCLNCRRRKKKCNESRPVCERCSYRGDACKWDNGISFKISSLAPRHPSMVQAELLSLKQDIQFHCMNLLSSDGEVIQEAGQNPQDFSAESAAPDTGQNNTAESALAEPSDIHSIYCPSVAYDQLHATLYNHMVERANAAALITPGPDNQNASINDHDTRQFPGLRETQGSSDECNHCIKPLKSVTVSENRQLELWHNYLEEIARWLDMFDHKCHFQFQVPLLARSADHLHYSILALSARQLERKDPEKPSTESLRLYQEAIRLLVRELHTLDTAVIASSVLLSVLEMMSSSPRAWGRHLEGCAKLLEAAGVNGVVGGVRSALFWCFARMDVWGGFLGETKTKIPTSRWLEAGTSINGVARRFKEIAGGDTYANYAVFVCANVVNLLYKAQASSGTIDSDMPNAARWNTLFDLLEDCYKKRPELMQPLTLYPADDFHSFPRVLYTSAAAANGNQLYHAASILMLQNKPQQIRLPRHTKSILWHARQICGIATSNPNHGAWINALQPLWIAGKMMSRKSEHQAILEILARVERETGWATAWRAQDLMEYWGKGDH